MEKKYMDVYLASELWDIAPREISLLCKAGLVEGAEHSPVDGRWIIPVDSPYPYNTMDDKVLILR